MKELDCKDCYYKEDCFYLEIGKEKNCITKYNRCYRCHDCGFDPSSVMDYFDDTENFYYIEDGKAKSILNSWVIDPDQKEYGILMPNNQVLGMISTVKRVVIYPIRDKWHTDFDGLSGMSGSGWRETHKCPKCNKEFSFWNSTL